MASLEELSADIGEMESLIAKCKRPKDPYGKDPAFVYVYLTSGLEGVGNVKERVSCDFTKSSFDLRVLDLNGKNYRLLKNNLDHEIIPHSSKVIIKKDSIKIKMAKAKGQYGTETWNDLVAKKSKLDPKGDPGQGIMDMMKQLYDDGDENMKKTIGEAMVKSRNKQINPNNAFDDDDDVPPSPY